MKKWAPAEWRAAFASPACELAPRVPGIGLNFLTRMNFSSNTAGPRITCGNDDGQGSFNFANPLLVLILLSNL